MPSLFLFLSIRLSLHLGYASRRTVNPADLALRCRYAEYLSWPDRRPLHSFVRRLGSAPLYSLRLSSATPQPTHLPRLNANPLDSYIGDGTIQCWARAAGGAGGRRAGRGAAGAAAAGVL